MCHQKYGYLWLVVTFFTGHSASQLDTWNNCLEKFKDAQTYQCGARSGCENKFIVKEIVCNGTCICEEMCKECCYAKVTANDTKPQEAEDLGNNRKNCTITNSNHVPSKNFKYNFICIDRTTKAASSIVTLTTAANTQISKTIPTTTTTAKTTSMMPTTNQMMPTTTQMMSTTTQMMPSLTTVKSTTTTVFNTEIPAMIVNNQILQEDFQIAEAVLIPAATLVIVGFLLMVLYLWWKRRRNHNKHECLHNDDPTGDNDYLDYHISAIANRSYISTGCIDDILEYDKQQQRRVSDPHNSEYVEIHIERNIDMKNNTISFTNKHAHFEDSDPEPNQDQDTDNVYAQVVRLKSTCLTDTYAHVIVDRYVKRANDKTEEDDEYDHIVFSHQSFKHNTISDTELTKRDNTYEDLSKQQTGARGSIGRSYDCVTFNECNNSSTVESSGENMSNCLSNNHSAESSYSKVKTDNCPDKMLKAETIQQENEADVIGQHIYYVIEKIKEPPNVTESE